MYKSYRCLLEQLNVYQPLNKEDNNIKEIIIVACNRHKNIFESLNQIKTKINEIILTAEPQIMTKLTQSYQDELTLAQELANQNKRKNIQSILDSLNNISISNLITIFEDKIKSVLALEKFVGQYLKILNNEVKIINSFEIDKSKLREIQFQLRKIEKKDYSKFYIDLNTLWVEKLKLKLPSQIKNYQYKKQIYDELIDNVCIDFIFRLCLDFDLNASQESNLKQKLLIWITQKLRLYYEVLDISRESSLEFKIDENDNNIVTHEPFTTIEDDQIISQNQLITNILEKLKEEIEQDKNNKFKNCHVENNQGCNCQLLILKCSKIFSNKSQKRSKIAQEINSKLNNLNSLWRRSCLPLLYESTFRLIDTKELEFLINEKEEFLNRINFENKQKLNGYFLAKYLLIDSENILLGIRKLIKDKSEFFKDYKEKDRFRTFCQSHLLFNTFKIIFSTDVNLH